LTGKATRLFEITNSLPAAIRFFPGSCSSAFVENKNAALFPAAHFQWPSPKFPDWYRWRGTIALDEVPHTQYPYILPAPRLGGKNAPGRNTENIESVIPVFPNKPPGSPDKSSMLGFRCESVGTPQTSQRSLRMERCSGHFLMSVNHACCGITRSRLVTDTFALAFDIGRPGKVGVSDM